nr:nucleotidyl transferase AbiEii/AbiGii toxin family protein [Paraburkholderia sp. NMBU_R16]
MRGFVLIGGTALTLRIGHRVSEDLDLAYAAGGHLPRNKLDVLARSMRDRGIKFALNQNPQAEEDFLDAGLELANYQQDFLANDTVKVSFIAPDPPEQLVIAGDSARPLRVATPDEIFALKSLVCAERSKTRDWFDLYILMTQHGFSVVDFYEVFLRYNAMPKFENAQMRLRRCKADAGDEGYEPLLTDAPSLDAIRAFFRTHLDQLEVRLAKQEFSSPSDE